MSGFIILDRSAFEHPLLKDGDRFRAFFWMVAKACWKPTPFDIGGRIITLQRGQFCASVRGMADEWGWSKSAVDRFLTRLETETMIERKAGHGKLVITICNYSKYQDTGEAGRDGSGTASGTAAGQQRDIKEQGNKGTIEEEPDGSSSPPTPQHTRMRDWPIIPDWVPVEPWNAFIAMRKRKGGMPTARAIELMLGKLERWRTTGQDPGAVLDQSTEKGWTGIFELKDDRRGSGNRTGQPADNRGDGLSRAINRWANLDDAEGDEFEPDRSAVRTGQGHRQGALALPGPTDG